jgi:hypothetical protein
MANFGEWLLKLGNAGAVRNAAAVVAERRAAEARASALLRRFQETSPSANGSSRRFGTPAA